MTWRELMPRFIESLSRNLKSKFSSKWFFHTAPFLITSQSNFDVMIWSHPIETYWNNYWKWDWKVPGQAFLVLNLLTLRSIHSLGSYPWGPWSASACPQKTTWRKMPLKNVFPTGGNHQHSNQVESKSWRKETVELALFVLPCDVRSVLRVCSN